MEDEVFEVDEFAIDPKGGAGVGKVFPFEPSAADGGAGDALVETREGACRFYFAISNRKTSYVC